MGKTGCVCESGAQVLIGMFSFNVRQETVKEAVIPILAVYQAHSSVFLNLRGFTLPVE